MPEKPKAILSDADGTLVDTVGLIRHGQYSTARNYLTLHGIPESEIPDYATYEILLNQTVGGSARDTLEKTVRLLYEDKAHHLEGIDFDELHSMLNPEQDKIAPEFVQAYDGLSQFFRTLGEKQIKLAIFTSGTPHHIVRNFGIALPELGLTELYKDTALSDEEKLAQFETATIEHFNLPGFTVVTCDDTTTHKPSPEGLEIAMERLGVARDEVLVLGDHTVDMQAAINAGIAERVGISHGFEDTTKLEASGATEVVDSLAKIALNFLSN